MLYPLAAVQHIQNEFFPDIYSFLKTSFIIIITFEMYPQNT